MEQKFEKRLEILYELKISDVMSPEVVTITQDTMMSELRAIMRTKRLSGLPVVNNEKLVGIISIEDLIVWLSGDRQDKPVSDNMTKNPAVLYPEQPLIHAIKRFEQTGFGRFPIVDGESGRLLGIITKGTIIEAVLKRMESEFEDEEIKRYRASHFFEDIAADHKEIILKYAITGQDFTLAGGASTSLKKNLKRLGIRPDIVQRVAIASFEAEINVVSYTDGGDMKFVITPDEITLLVKDNGPGIEDVEKAMQPGYTTAPQWIKDLGFGSGMGLSNMKRCSDVMKIDSKPGSGTAVNIVIFLKERE